MNGLWLLSLGILASVTHLDTAQAADWPQWRGPERTGISKETGLLKEWPQSGPNLLWQATNLGSGYSTPAVVGERLFLLRNDGLESESVEARSVQNGAVLWTARIGKVGNPDQNPRYPAARSTPTIEGKHLYALGSDGDMVCLETATGKSVWHKNLRTDFDGIPGIWAYSESPLLDGNCILCTPGGTNATIAALDKRTGNLLWKCVVPEGDPAGYASIVVSHAGGIKQDIQFLQNGLVGVDARTGRFLWRYNHTAKNSPANIPTPVADGDYVYSAASRSGGGLIHLKNGTSGFEVKEVCFSQKLPTSIGGSIKLGDCLYGTTVKTMLCADFKTGTLKWENPGIGAASLCYADGMFYLHGENGEVALVEATPSAYHLKGHFSPPGQPDRGPSKAWTYPVVANGRLYIRDFGVLWCYQVKAK